MAQTKDVDSETAPKLSKRRLKAIHGDSAKSAEAVNLRYVGDSEAGITRIRKGSGFAYQLGDKPLKDKATLERVQAMVLPPAWQDVWICKDAEGHLQATGVDALGRKQYRYHTAWNALRSQTKFVHLFEFGKALR